MCGLYCIKFGLVIVGMYNIVWLIDMFMFRCRFVYFMFWYFSVDL